MERFGEEDEVFSADRGYLDTGGVLVVDDVGFEVLGDQLFGGDETGQDFRLDEVYESVCMRFVTEEEINPFSLILDINSLISRPTRKYKLL